MKLSLAAPVLLFVVFVPFLAGGPDSDGAGTSPSPTPTGTRIATFTLTIYYNPAMAPGWFTEEMVKDYVVAWNGITPGVNVFYGGETTATVQCGVQTDASAQASVIAWQRLPSYEPDIEIHAKTCVAFDGQSCDVRLDPRYPNMDYRQVVAHEVGHCLGMKHIDNLAALMHSPAHEGEHILAPQPDDIAQFCLRYVCETR